MTFAPREAGGVSVTTIGSLMVLSGGQIRSDTFGNGQASTVTVQADRLLVSRDGSSEVTGISSDANRGSTGQAGAVAVSGRDLTVRDGGQISSRADAGAAGAGGIVKVHGGDIRLADGGTITTQSESPQHAGDVTITADSSLSLTGGAQIASSASQADAGSITITTPSTLQLSDESSVITAAQQGGGGRITLTAGRLIDLVGSRIISSTFGPNVTQNAGNITIDPPFLVLDRSSIAARANRGRGGNIRITPPAASSARRTAGLTPPPSAGSAARWTSTRPTRISAARSSRSPPASSTPARCCRPPAPPASAPPRVA